MATATRKKKTVKPKPVALDAAKADKHPEYVSISWMAKKFGKSRSAIHRAVQAGKIKSIPFPSAGEKRDQWLIPYSEVERIEAGKFGA